MDATVYSVEAGIEANHWWFVARRRLVAALIARAGVPVTAEVLDVGSGTGTNLRLLKALGFARRRGLDPSDEAIRWCAEKGLGEVTRGDASDLPFGDGAFQLVLATDVLEHVQDDVRAASEIRRVLRPGGTAIFTVPAFRVLWGLQDEVARHRRRYRRREFLEVLRRGGLECRDSFYFNYLLFGPIWLGRRMIRALRIPLASENQVTTPALNRLLTWIFTLDVASAGIVRPPFGVSIAAVATRD